MAEWNYDEPTPQPSKENCDIARKVIQLLENDCKGQNYNRADLFNLRDKETGEEFRPPHISSIENLTQIVDDLLSKNVDLTLT